MAELEALRKRATNTTPKAKKESPSDAPPAGGREVHKAINLTAPPDSLGNARTLKVTLSLESGDGTAVPLQEERVELGDGAEIRSVSLNLRIDPA
jgi:hypothetical protein